MKAIDDLRVPAEPEPEPRRRHPGRLVALAIVVAVALVGLGFVLGSDGDDDGGGAPTPTTTTTAATTTSPVVDRSTAIWPVAGSPVRYTDPVDAARGFAVTFLGFSSPLVGEFQQGDSRSGEVEIRPRARGPVTTVLVRQLTNETTWSVLGAATANIEVTAPLAGETVVSPLRLTGRARAFEGTVQVEVREDAERGAIGAGFVTGGGDIMRPFDGEVAFETPGSPYGALVFFTESAENGEVWEAAALRVRFSSPDADAASCGGYLSPRFDADSARMEVKAYFNCDATDREGALVAVYRSVPRSSGVLRASLDALFAGPTAAERDAGIGSWFSSATAGMVRGVTIRDGHAVVDVDDLRTVIPNASSSAGSQRLLAELDATVFQFRSVTSVEYRLEGSCAAFNEWLQYGGCEPRTRPASED